MKQEFNPEDWLPKTNSSVPSANADNQSINPSVHQSINPSVHQSIHQSIRPSLPLSSEVDLVIARIEADLADIAPSYADWVNVGFALANEFGESGRAYFHRVSRFYTGYTKAETDKQYDRCLQSQGHGITIKTFFHLAKQAGVEVGRQGAWGKEQGEKGMEQGAWGEGHGEVFSGQSQCSEPADQNGSPSTDQSISPSGRSGQSQCSEPADQNGSPSTDQSISSSGRSGQSQCSDTADQGNSPSVHQSINPSIHSGQSQCSEPVDQCISPSIHQSLSPSDPSEDDPPEEEQPTLPDNLYEQLPDFFKRVVARADSREERDMLLLGSIVALGSCLTTFSGIYDGNQVFPTLFLYIAAKASSGKGRLVMVRNLINPVHWEKRKQSQQENQVYEVELREYNAQKGKDPGMEKPPKPPVRMHIIPANNTTAGLLQLLADNDGQGIIIETEGDTIAKTIKKEMSDFSDFMRKGFHHEMISGYRKTDHEHSEVEQPRFNMILSSTMGQLKELIPNTENGLSSRFMFYYMNLRPVWKDVFAHSNTRSLNQHFNELGQEFYHFYRTLQATDRIEFRLSDPQQEEFNALFARMQDKYLVLQGLDYMAIVRRLGLIAFRMMMILTAMRIPETGDYSVKQECSDEDFETSLAIIQVLVRHASYIVAQMPEEVKTTQRGNKKEKFFEGLGERFDRKDYLVVAKSLNVSERSADRFMASFCDKNLIQKEQLGIYLKLKQ